MEHSLISFLQHLRIDKPKVRVLPGGDLITPTNLKDAIPSLTALNTSGKKNLYILINEGTDAKDSAITSINALFIDDDEDKLPHYQNLPLQPTMVVKSARGYHYYWRLKAGESVERFKTAQQHLASYFGTDTTISNPARIMRAPGFFRYKDSDKPVMTYLEYVDNEREYTIDEVLKAYPVSEVVEQVSTGFTEQKKLQLKTKIRKEAKAVVDKHPPAIQGHNGDVCTYELACKLVCDYDLSPAEALPLMIDWNAKCNPPWNREELHQKLLHAKAYATGERGSALTRILPRYWVEKWLTFNNAQFSYPRDQFFIPRLRLEDFLSKMEIDAKEDDVFFSQTDLYNALQWHTFTMRQTILETLTKRISYKQDPNRNLARFVKAIKPDATKLDFAVMAHFIWSVKRKINDLPVVWHMMPILFHPKHGTGKTTAITHLLSPISDLTDAPPGLSWTGDDRELFRLTSSYVIFCDEMAQADKADVDRLRNIITSETVSYRILGTNKRASDNNTATLIGNTNRPVIDLIRDTTGMRRYYQMDTADPINWDAINTIDYVALWQSVDEKADSPILPYLPQLHGHQEQLRTKDSVEEWLSTCVTASDYQSTGELYRHYREYCDQSGFSHPLAVSAFGRRLSALLPSDKKKIDHKNGSKYLIYPKNALIAMEIN